MPSQRSNNPKEYRIATGLYIRLYLTDHAGRGLPSKLAEGVGDSLLTL